MAVEDRPLLQVGVAIVEDLRQELVRPHKAPEVLAEDAQRVQLRLVAALLRRPQPHPEAVDRRRDARLQLLLRALGVKVRRAEGVHLGLGVDALAVQLVLQRRG